MGKEPTGGRFLESPRLYVGREHTSIYPVPRVPKCGYRNISQGNLPKGSLIRFILTYIMYPILRRSVHTSRASDP